MFQRNHDLMSVAEFSQPYLLPPQGTTSALGSPPRELEECVEVHNSGPEGARKLTDDELVMLVQNKVRRLLKLQDD